jgi:hypothetical protein
LGWYWDQPEFGEKRHAHGVWPKAEQAAEEAGLDLLKECQGTIVDVDDHIRPTNEMRVHAGDVEEAAFLWRQITNISFNTEH